MLYHSTAMFKIIRNKTKWFQDQCFKSLETKQNDRRITTISTTPTESQQERRCVLSARVYIQRCQPFLFSSCFFARVYIQRCRQPFIFSFSLFSLLSFAFQDVNFFLFPFQGNRYLPDFFQIIIFLSLKLLLPRKNILPRYQDISSQFSSLTFLSATY